MLSRMLWHTTAMRGANCSSTTGRGRRSMQTGTRATSMRRSSHAGQVVRRRGWTLLLVLAADYRACYGLLWIVEGDEIVGQSFTDLRRGGRFDGRYTTPTLGARPRRSYLTSSSPGQQHDPEVAHGRAGQRGRGRFRC